MKSINAKRLRGRGLGTQMGFPTINININTEVETGLYFCTVRTSGWSGFEESAIISISKPDKKIPTLAGEIHVPDRKVSVEVGENLTVTLMKKLREHTNFIHPSVRMQKDIDLFGKVQKRKCTDCNLCYSEDYGYSNWTVEGTDWGCYAAEAGEDTPFEKAGKLGATFCDLFIEGEHYQIDVDKTAEAPSENEILAMIRDAKIKSIGI